MQFNGLNQQHAAMLLGITARTLRDWADAPRNADGTYNATALVKYYVEKLTNAGDYDNQRERLAAAQAEKVEMENALRRGRLADLDLVERFWSECIVNARTRMLGMGAKLGPQLVNIADASLIATAIRSEARAALAELAEYTAGDQGSDTAGGATMAPAAGPDDQPMGGPGAPVKQRKQRRAGAVAN